MEPLHAAPPVLGIIIPCYNEEEVIRQSAAALLALLTRLIDGGKVSAGSFIAFVDDGSDDGTWGLMEKLAEGERSFKALKLSGNFGHQSALLAGLHTFNDEADCLVSIDADLQDDISVIEAMIDRFRDGYEIVYGVRKSRGNDTFFKKVTAHFFYELMRKMGVRIIYNHADFRLTSSRAVRELRQFKEVNLFLRGLFPIIGLKSTEILYDRGDRLAGQSKYPLRKMLGFALDGITSFSVKPLRLLTVTGFLLFLASICMSIYAVLSYVIIGTVHGWASIVLPMYLLGGVQMLGIGIIGEYLGKIYKEVKQRPRYIIEKELR